MCLMLPMLLCVAQASSASLPNIVFVLADDVGYGDLSSYGATKVATPNLDSIAKHGVRFTDAHSPSTICTPTRYSVLTGRSAMRNTKAHQVINGVAPCTIEPDIVTLPSKFKLRGYATGIVGKWHLGLGAGPEPTDYSKPIDRGPNQVGFDYSFILPATGDRVPCVYLENGRVVGDDPSDPIKVSYRGKIGDEPTGKENPDLLRVKLRVGHDGTIVNGVSRIGHMIGGKKARWIDEDMADTFTRAATKFIDTNQSKPFFLLVTPHDIHAPQLPHKRFEGQSDCGLRGDTLRELDWTVGELLAALRARGLDRNTIFIFSSDNGGVVNDGYDDPRENLNGHKVNGDLRGEKYSPYEGGHRVPFLLQWPSQVAGGQVSSALINQIDLYRSLASVAGYPLDNGEAPESENVLDALLGKSQVGRSQMLIHVGAQVSAWRSGSWVYIPRPQGKPELYDLATDLAQTKNLSETHPNKLQELVSQHEAFTQKLREP